MLKIVDIVQNELRSNSLKNDAIEFYLEPEDPSVNQIYGHIYEKVTKMTIRL